VEVSGTLWTRDPGSGSGARWTAEAVYGEGGPGEGAADQYVFDPLSGTEVLPALLADKREKLAWDAGRKALVKASIPPGLSLLSCLSAERLKKLARAGRALDAYFGGGLEVSFAFQGERLLITGLRTLDEPKAVKAAAEPFAIPEADATVPSVRSLPKAP
jgi:hypothetical protein